METLQSLRRDLALAIGEYTEVRVTDPDPAAPTQRFTSDDLRLHFSANQQCRDYWVVVEAPADPANLGAVSRVGDYDATAARATLRVALPAALRPGDVLGLYQRLHPRSYHAAINRAIATCWPYWYRHVIDRSLLTLPGTYGYTLPNGLNADRLVRVELEVRPDDPTYPWAVVEDWRVERSVDASGAVTATLRLGELLPADRRLALWVADRIPPLAAETDPLLVGEDVEATVKAYLTYEAGAAVLETLLAAVDLDNQERYGAVATRWRNLASGIRARNAMPVPRRPFVTPGRGTATAPTGSAADRLALHHTPGPL